MRQVYWSRAWLHPQPLLCPFLCIPLHLLHPSSSQSFHFQAFTSLFKYSIIIIIQSPNSFSKPECPSWSLSKYPLICPVHIYLVISLIFLQHPSGTGFCHRDKGLAVQVKGWAMSVWWVLVTDSGGLGFPSHYCFFDHCLLLVFILNSISQVSFLLSEFCRRVNSKVQAVYFYGVFH